MKARQLLLVFLPGLERYASKYFEIFLIIPLSTTILRCQLTLCEEEQLRKALFFGESKFEMFAFLA